MRKFILGIVCMLFSSGWAIAGDMVVEFTDPVWDGKTIPDGQQCGEYDGQGATPPLKISNIPAAANSIIIEFNDEDYAPLSEEGGHGVVGYEITPGVGEVSLIAVPGDTENTPEGTWIENDNRDDLGVVGYLPPCSGGQGNLYSAKVLAAIYEDDDYEVVGEVYFQLGKY